VFFFPVALSLLSLHSQLILLGVEISFVSWLGRLTETCLEYCDNKERSTGKKNTTMEWDDSGIIGNKTN
jgi:hypothetical protein